jgi:hypothetical protein
MQRMWLDNNAVCPVKFFFSPKELIPIFNLDSLKYYMEKLLIYVLFSKSGLAGQHKYYLTPIVSTSFSLTSIYKHHLTFLVICEQHEIDNYFHLPTFY